MPSLQLVCLPFAGAGASFFRIVKPPADVDVIAIQLPGREERFGEPPPEDVRTSADEIADKVRQLTDPSVPTAVFGHSLGAVLAFETALRLNRAVSHVFVSGSPDPWSPRDERASDLTDSEFLDRVEVLAGYQHPALADPEMREIILPALKADVAMHELYSASAGAKIDAPVTALRGSCDQLVSEEQMLGWNNATSGRFSLTTVQGGHMYLAENLADTLELIANAARQQRV